MFTPVACSSHSTGIPAPPACPPGAAEGTPVDVFFEGACEGYFVLPENVESDLAGLTASPLAIYAAYRTPPDGWDGIVRADGGYSIVVAAAAPGSPAMTALVSGGGLVGFFRNCVDTPEQVLSRVQPGDFVIPPVSRTPIANGNGRSLGDGQPAARLPGRMGLIPTRRGVGASPGVIGARSDSPVLCRSSIQARRVVRW